MQAEPQFAQPPLQRVPFVPATAGEDALPVYVAPTREEVPPVELPELQLPDAPVIPPRPATYEPGKPKHGQNWTGELPNQVPIPVYSGAEAEQEPDLELPACPDAPPQLV